MIGERPRRAFGRRSTAWAIWFGLALLVGVPVGAAYVHSPAAFAPIGPARLLPAAPATPSGFAPAIKIPPPPQPTWINVTSSVPGASPPESVWGSSAYDAANNETVYFGGCLTGDCSVESDQTWVFSHGRWANVTDAKDAPPARAFASMDYDANMQGVLLFGGTNGPVTYDDTWLFQNGSWTNVTYYSTAPAARYGAAMAFDPQPEENGSVLFGGYAPGIGYINSTWIWQGGSGWVPMTTSSLAPPQVCYTGMAYDAASGDIVQFGGFEESGALDDATWELYSGQWWPVDTPTSPGARDYDALVADPGQSGVLLVDGYTGSAEENNTWVFSSNAWTKESPSVAPPARDSFGIALDGTGTTPILVGGGSTDQLYNDTWAYEFAPVLELGENSSTGEIGQTLDFSAAPYYGTAPFSVEFNWGDGTYGFVSGSGSDLPITHVYSHAGTFSVSATITDAVGATATSLTTLTVTISGQPSIGAQADPSVVDPGSAVAFSSDLTVPSAPPYTYTWAYGDGQSGSGANTSHDYSAPGTYRAVVTVTDHDGATATAAAVVTVVPEPAVVAGTTFSKPLAGSADQFYANTSGGVAPFHFVWAFGDGSSPSTSPAPAHTFAQSGTYTVEVWANDSSGASAHSTLSVTVGPANTSTGHSTGGATTTTTKSAPAPTWFWLGVVGLVLVAGIGSALIAWRSRAPKKPST